MPTTRDPADAARSFAARLIAWQRRHGRHDLPWHGTRDPYRVWLSEVMLQQTQVATVVPYYTRFLAHFPDVHALARAPVRTVMTLWAGLGYYARARNLHACAKIVARRFDGVFPQRADELAQLPGIGPSTAAAIAAFCFDERAAILDGNVRRVLTRHFGIDGDPGRPDVARRLAAQARALLPPARAMPVYTQALMDFGATLCTARSPGCTRCPLRASCVARADARVEALPARRLAKPRRLRKAFLLVAVQGRRVWVEQRPADGVWGGLLSLPQFESRAAVERALRAVDRQARWRWLAPRRHAFTHFTLVATPCVAVLRTSPAPRRHGQRWLALARLAGAPLPAPIRVLLAELAAGPGALS